MTSTAKSAISLDTSALVDTPPGGPPSLVDSADVNVPFGEMEGHLETGRERLSVTVNDTHMKHLSDAISVGSGLTKTTLDPGGDEQIQLDAVRGVPGVRLHTSTILSGVGSLPAFLTLSSELTGRMWLLVARLRGTEAAISTNLQVAIFTGGGASNYFAQQISAAGASVAAAETVGTNVGLLGSSAPIPANNSPTGSYATFIMHLFSASNNGITVRWRLHSGLAESSGNIRWLAGTGWYKLATSAGLLLTHNGSNSWINNCGYWLYEFI